MNFLENITLQRSGRTRTKSDSQSNVSQYDNELLTQTMDDTATSVPDMSKDDSYDQELIAKLKKQVEKLTLQLSSAEEEISTLDNLTLENNNLKQSNEELQKINILYKKKLPTALQKNLRKNYLPPKKFTKQTNTNRATKYYQKKMNDKGSQTTVLVSETVEQKKPVVKTGIPHSEKQYLRRIKNSKLCIISENKYNKIRKIAEGKLQNSEICHYLMPYAGINNMIRDLKPKLKKITLDDYCIILIGETDFKTTKEYSNIRKVLNNIQHTNVILCMPTYKICASNVTMYNRSVEHFNHLLYQDILAHEHAFFVDTNKNLTWDYKMYKKYRNSK
ncbi:unnamed protein product [Parnassius apollo]|uniref:(apollo) hypothetical protein n=1 Tax=Parnassius apollo TaxID=110799 RepID=A0A8S3WNZ1_PARAO|nr:unnamed protein product [Parnassius apollo]